ncbi:hypothetical protein [Pseudonocardia sp. H11422]|uniref:hypothetical protein n=1 Tax=Pseudonocardia sp. H11422 TaxID=2835866 RepID=UPI00202907DA|nr:hypothetical protein [Pseudonocardia sp. H11422]
MRSGVAWLPAFGTLWAVLAHAHPVPEEAEPLLAPLTRWPSSSSAAPVTTPCS